MSDRAKKSIGQDAVGVLFCLIGGFFLVSIYLNWRGNEPVYAPATQPVLELVALFGLVPAALLSLGVAAIGAWIFLASLPPAVGRPLAALALGTTGFALILGAFAWGGSLGDVFPGLVDGTVGRLIGAVLGVVVAFLAFTLVAPSGPAASTADVMRAGIGGRNEHASGVSTAEATLLGGEPRPATRPAARHDEPARRDQPLREETLRPLAPEKARAAAPIARPLEATAAPSAPAAELPRPSAPAWEAEREEELDEDEELAPAVAQRAETDEDDSDEELAEELAEALHADAEEEADEAEGDGELQEEELVTQSAPGAEVEPAQAERTPPAASWEQVSLFDEEKEEDAEPSAPAATPVATGTLDFGEPAQASHEPERGNPDDPFAAEPVVPPAPPVAALAQPAESPEELEEELDEAELDEEAEELAAELEEEEADEEELEADEEAAELEEEPTLAFEEPAPVAAPTPAPVRAPAPAAKAEVPAAAPEFVLQPRPAARPEPVVARDGESEKWQKLVFDSGLLILEQKRVAVSMLERRFGLDFDSACRVLDELQQAGLIGPYIGGRTREILLTKEQWQAQAAETA